MIMTTCRTRAGPQIRLLLIIGIGRVFALKSWARLVSLSDSPSTEVKWDITSSLPGLISDIEGRIEIYRDLKHDVKVLDFRNIMVVIEMQCHQTDWPA